jgi:rhamnose transport system ATP-binding protein
LSRRSLLSAVLQLTDIFKSFAGVNALTNVRFDVCAGEVHALLGENGAGKSTLIKIMAGVHKPDAGTIQLDGKPVTFASPREASYAGIGTVYQEPLLFPDLNVAENIFIGHPNRGVLTNWRQMSREAEALLATLGVVLDVRSPARGLTLAAQQSVEIAKAISLNVRVLIMDEPTASLSTHEVAQIFKIVRDLRDRGVAVIFVSHRMEEVFEIADRITVFRDGRLVSTRSRADATPQRAIADMVGREVGLFKPRTPAKKGGVILSVRGLGREGAFRDVTFDVRRGEVLGLAGLVGSGRTDVALALFGIRPATSGSIVLNGQARIIRSPREAMASGIAYLSEDRRQLGLSLPMSVAANISLPSLKRYLTRLGLIRTGLEKSTAEAFRERLVIRTPSVELPVAKLSGGNQQKVMLSKWLNTHPVLLILDEPTRGIDVGAKTEVHTMIGELASEGIGIVMISSELPEVLSMSDRVLIMREGRQIATLDREEATEEVVMNAAMGQAFRRSDGA